MRGVKAKKDQRSEVRQRGHDSLRVVGIGASAGGLGACTALLEHLPADTGMAFVVIFHLDPMRESHLGALLERSTEMPVSTIDAATPLQPNHVYVIAPGTVVDLADDIATPSPREEIATRRKPIDTLFECLASDKREYAIGVVLSGTGDDGTRGLTAIKRAGGISLVQSPESSDFTGMPGAALKAEVVDKALRPHEIGPYLAARVGQRRAASAPLNGVIEAKHALSYQEDSSQISADSHEFAGILRLLSKHFGLSFEDYRSGTIIRRISRRMGINGVDDAAEYLRCLRTDEAELATLHQDLLIDVTRFFRDPEMWTFLREAVIPKIVQGVADDGELRFWVSACSTGEEAYSLAMLVLDELDAADKSARVQVFATDINDRALDVARRGRYSLAIADDVQAEHLAQYFERRGEHFRVRPRLRDAVTFAKHNLLENPPFSRMDMVTCRNLLIYLKSEAQKRALRALHYALNPGAYLVLGTSESISGSELALDAVSKHLRVFQASGESADDARPDPAKRVPSERARPNAAAPPELAVLDDSHGQERSLDRYILSHYAPAVVIITKTLEIRHFYGPTDEYLRAPTGTANLDLLSWLRPGLYAGVQGALKEAMRDSKRVETSVMQLESGERTMDVTCLCEPLAATPGGEGLYLVMFRTPPSVDSSEDRGGSERALVKRLETQVREADVEKKHLLERLNATSESYQAHHEELLSLNEELQSSNEELESSTEELQSLNEELLTVNQALEQKNAELSVLNADLKNLFVSTNIPTIFLDSNHNIRRFTPAATRVMHLASADIGRPISEVKERYDQRNLVELAQAVLVSGELNVREVRADDGNYYQQRILPYRNESGAIDGVCITFSDITEARQAANQAEKSREYSDAVIRTVRTALLVLDEDLCVTRANAFFKEQFMETATPVEGVRIFDVGQGRWDIPGLRDLLVEVLPEESEVINYEVVHDFGAARGERVLRINAHTMVGGGDIKQILLSIEDVTEQRNYAAMMQQRSCELELESARKNEFLAMLGHELRNPLAALSYGLEFLEKSKSPEKKESTQRMMRRQLDRMTSMLDQLLEMTRIIQGKIALENEPLDLTEVARHAVEVVLPRAEQREQYLSVQLAPDGELVLCGDANRLAQVMENLLINAVKYTDEGGSIEVELKKEDDHAVFLVKDSGAGIGDDFMPIIFDLFAQAKRTLDRAEGGFGLGLPLAKELVEMHKGELTAYSEGLGMGSTFTFRLPLDPSIEIEPTKPGADLTDTAKPDESQESEATRVLIIDDEPDLGELFVRLLERKGYRAKMANDGASGIELTRTFKPRVILLDLGLPEMDGYEVASKLRQEFGDRDIFIIAVSGYSRDSAKLEASGFDNHLLKPPDMKKFYGWIEALD